MSRYHTNGSDRWAHPRQPMDASERRRRFGPIQPMQPEPRSSWLRRIFGRL